MDSKQRDEIELLEFVGEIIDSKMYYSCAKEDAPFFNDVIGNRFHGFNYGQLRIFCHQDNEQTVKSLLKFGPLAGKVISYISRFLPKLNVVTTKKLVLVSLMLLGISSLFIVSSNIELEIAPPAETETVKVKPVEPGEIQFIGDDVSEFTLIIKEVLDGPITKIFAMILLMSGIISLIKGDYIAFATKILMIMTILNLPIVTDLVLNLEQPKMQELLPGTNSSNFNK